MATSHRVEQVGELLKIELSQMLLREVEWPEGTLVTITRVTVTPDMKQAKVWISVLPFGRRFVALEKLKKLRYELQTTLNEKLSMKFVPKIEFSLDKTEEEASHIEELIDNISKES